MWKMIPLNLLIDNSTFIYYPTKHRVLAKSGCYCFFHCVSDYFISLYMNVVNANNDRNVFQVSSRIIKQKIDSIRPFLMFFIRYGPYHDRNVIRLCLKTLDTTTFHHYMCVATVEFISMIKKY